MQINWLLLIGFIVLCNLLGSLGAIWTASDRSWYNSINKPSFNPPSWVFGPVWTLLFTALGIALYFIWVAPSSQVKIIALSFFIIQFIFNILWSYLFFGVNNPLWSLIEILVLLIFILATGVSFFMINRLAGYLIMPYFIWVSFATFLNYNLWILNR